MTRSTFVRYVVPNIGAILVFLFAFTGQLGATGSSSVLGQAASTTTISYQGRLTNASGQPLNATVPMVFRLYAAPAGGTALWTESRTSTNAVPAAGGLFNVLLGSVTPISLNLLSRDLWLGISVNGDAEMTPREKLGTVPYAARAGQAQTVADGGISTTKLANGAVTRAKIADHSLVRTFSDSEAKIQHGSFWFSSDACDSATITFPQPFSQPPVVIITQREASAGFGSFLTSAVTPTSFNVNKGPPSCSTDAAIDWIAIGN